MRGQVKNPGLLLINCENFCVLSPLLSLTVVSKVVLRRGAGLEDISKTGLEKISKRWTGKHFQKGLLWKFCKSTQPTSRPHCQYSTITVLSSII